jgi:hypothetical protein
MRTHPGSEIVNEDRRQFLSTAATGIAAASAASLFPAFPAPAATGDAIRPFRVNVPEEALVDLRRGLGTASTLFRRGSCGLQITAQIVEQRNHRKLAN